MSTHNVSLYQFDIKRDERYGKVRKGPTTRRLNGFIFLWIYSTLTTPLCKNWSENIVYNCCVFLNIEGIHFSNVNKCQPNKHQFLFKINFLFFLLFEKLFIFFEFLFISFLLFFCSWEMVFVQINDFVILRHYKQPIL